MTDHRTDVRPVLNPRWRGQWAATCTCGWISPQLFKTAAATAARNHQASTTEDTP